MFVCLSTMQTYSFQSGTTASGGLFTNAVISFWNWSDPKVLLRKLPWNLWKPIYKSQVLATYIKSYIIAYHTYVHYSSISDLTAFKPLVLVLSVHTSQPSVRQKILKRVNKAINHPFFVQKLLFNPSLNFYPSAAMNE